MNPNTNPEPGTRNRERPCLAWLTDFGTRDHYVGTMKGVALGICGDATFIDITHEIDPQDVLGGALELAAAVAYFPPRTTFVAIVDPGVGSGRRALAAEAGPYRFVAPDNGVLSLVFEQFAPARVVEITAPEYMRSTVSRTFEGRDRFAPAAAWLAGGTDLARLGAPVVDWVRLAVPRPVVDDTTIGGEILRVDRFGNLISNIDRATVARLGAGSRVRVSLGGQVVGLLADTYASVVPGAPCALFSSSGHLEIAVNGGSAARRFGAGRGTNVLASSVGDAEL